jgi:hypothetical protein
MRIGRGLSWNIGKMRGKDLGIGIQEEEVEEERNRR